jgi:CPA2 family monovalent cation:H+ antiporter-2
LSIVIDNLPWVLATLGALLLVKLVLAAGLSRLFGASPGVALRTGLWLCAGGEFGFVLLEQITDLHLLSSHALQIVLGALVLSLLLAPLIVHFSDRLVLRFVASEWLLRSMQLTQIAARSISAERHAILCGYGRTGQHLARFLEQEGVSYVALDLDPERVTEAANAGEPVTFGDCARRETLVAAGIGRANVLVITFADSAAALRVLHHVRDLRPDLPVVARGAEDADVDLLASAGAAEVVPEALESSVMLATHALALLGVPMHRVIKRLREMREARYVLLRGFFHGASDASEHLSDAEQPRLHAVMLSAGAYAVGRTVAELALEQSGVKVSTVRRRGTGRVARGALLMEGDAVVLLGVPEALANAEEWLLGGRGK